MLRRPLIWIVALSALLHGIAIARSSLPAQDGIKYIRAAKAMQRGPWLEALRGTDQHPLYPALIAVVEPVVRLFAGPGPDAWRIAAQVVAALAAVLVVIPIYRISFATFGGPTALRAALFYVLLPLPAQVGHDTLADSLALLAFTTALWYGLKALNGAGWNAWAACGAISGLGYLARPEVAILPIVIVTVAVASRLMQVIQAAAPASTAFRTHGLEVPAMLLALFLPVGLYALAKGEVSEKLAVRTVVRGVTEVDHEADTPQPTLPGLDDPAWDFSPKEEFDQATRLAPGTALQAAFVTWSENMGWILAPLTLVGLMIVHRRTGFRGFGRVGVVYALIFGAILLRHAANLGYLSNRHTLTLVVLAVPWAAAGVWTLGRRLAGLFGVARSRQKRLRWEILGIAVILGALLQCREPHPSRWGHWAAGRWLAEHAQPNESVLDTRGWAAFISGRPSYDYWHVRQALTDSSLAYVVVDGSELSAPSARAESLRTLLETAGTPVASFPAHKGDDEPSIWVYRFQAPDSWEGIRP